VSAVSGAEIAQRGAPDFRDVAALTPGVTFTSTNAAEPVISIRGISSGGEGAASDSGVLMMIDGEVIPRDFMRSAPLFDVERVEVLRGPQGTTYGRNATAGVLHVINARPSDRFQANLGVEAGNYASVVVNGAVNVPLGPDTAVRAAVLGELRDGYFRNSATGQRIDDRSTLAARVSLRHDFSDTFQLLLRANGSRERHGETAPTQSPNGLVPLIDAPFAVPPYVEGDDDPYIVTNRPGGYFDRDIWGASAEMNLALGGVDMVSLTAFRHGSNDFFTGTAGSYNDINGINRADVFSQELRLSGGDDDSPVFWSVGAFYINEDVLFGYDRGLLPGTGFSTTQRLRQNVEIEGLGLFGEIAFRPFAGLTLTAGGRYSSDKKRFAIDNRAAGPIADAFVTDPTRPLLASAKDSWSQPTFRGSVRYEFTPDISAYATYSQGYKAGGFNSEPADLEAATTTFDEETVDNYEVGFRSSFFDRRLDVNVTGFEMRYDDIQSAFFTLGGTEITTNSGQARIRGVEVEAAARPTRWLQLSGSYANYDAEYVDYVDPEGIDLRGTRLARTPEWTLTAGALVTVPLTNGGSIRLRGDYRTRGAVFNEAPADPVAGVRPGVDMVDMRLTYAAPRNWDFSIFARNLLDRAEIQYISPQVILEQRPVIYGPPRTIGASFTVRFR
jgi:iron complex outermembrane receptor protein